MSYFYNNFVSILFGMMITISTGIAGKFCGKVVSFYWNKIRRYRCKVNLIIEKGNLYNNQSRYNELLCIRNVGSNFLYLSNVEVRAVYKKGFKDSVFLVPPFISNQFPIELAPERAINFKSNGSLITDLNNIVQEIDAIYLVVKDTEGYEYYSADLKDKLFEINEEIKRYSELFLK
ncbi:hypothetical protein [Apilactobacillus kunkeei]|uniref:hypothetical protein n=1 Tax=Apilactobacillus kunkeei TaxID=148814 RepID=UPI0006C64B9F|nr:hypothetical protein [Apilactobacillus kunkeei]KOY71592.1 hypothetical protein RZ55_08990 [Apilactobacillus kunkeei]